MHKPDDATKVPCPHCGSSDTLKLQRNLICHACKRVSPLDRQAHGEEGETP